jgi:hypothetical protein
MLSYKEFYIWLQGYLTDKSENIDIEPILKKMVEVKDFDPFFPHPRTITQPTFEPIPVAPNPFKDDGYDELGTPPKIVM